MRNKVLNKITENIFHVFQIFLFLIITIIAYFPVKILIVSIESIFLKLAIILLSIFLILFCTMMTQVILQLICIIFLIGYSRVDFMEVGKIYSEVEKTNSEEGSESRLETLYYLITKKLIEKNVLFLYNVKSLFRKLRENKIIILKEDLYNEITREITEIINKNEIENLNIHSFTFEFLEKPSLETPAMKKIWQEWKNLEYKQRIFDFVFDYLMRFAFPLIDKEIKKG